MTMNGLTRCQRSIYYMSRAAASNYSVIMRPNTVYLRRRSDSDQIFLDFHYTNTDLNISKQFSFSRCDYEPISNIVQVVHKKLSKAFIRKKQYQRCPFDIEMAFTVNNEVISDMSLSCGKLFETTNQDQLNDIRFNLIGTEYVVVVNAPWIRALTLPSFLICGCPVYFKKSEFMYSTQLNAKFEWYISKNRTDWTLVSINYPYTPDKTAIGSYLKLLCTPRRRFNENSDEEFIEGSSLELISSRCIIDAPEEYPFERRQQNCTDSPLADRQFRVVSYNILADLYTTSVYAREMLFSFCPSSILDMDYRKQLILKELQGYNADIICLQEVDEKIYSHYKQILHAMCFPFDMEFCIKGGRVTEGLALIYRTTRLKMLQTERIILADHLATNPIYTQIWQRIATNENLAKRLLARTTVLQTTVLESLENPNEILVVGNTHLYFHPDADNIRLLQSAFNILYLEDLIKRLKTQIVGKRISLVFCGDFNSTPDSGVLELFTTGKVPKDCPDFQSNEDECISDVDLKHSSILNSAYDNKLYTNVSPLFSGCIDYIYYQCGNFQLEKIVPLPSAEELRENVAIPSRLYPSDHVALVCDLKLT